MKSEATHLLQEGKYQYEHKMDFEYKEGELILDDNDVDKIEIHVKFGIQIIKPVIVSKFDIKNRGRFLDQKFRLPCDATLNVKLVASKK